MINSTGLTCKVVRMSHLIIHHPATIAKKSYSCTHACEYLLCEDTESSSLSARRLSLLLIDCFMRRSLDIACHVSRWSSARFTQPARSLDKQPRVSPLNSYSNDQLCTYIVCEALSRLENKQLEAILSCCELLFPNRDDLSMWLEVEFLRLMITCNFELLPLELLKHRSMVFESTFAYCQTYWADHSVKGSNKVRKVRK